jgi:hypothetical protein
MLGHLMEWFYSGLCGIRQEEHSTAFKRIIIDPQPAGDISFAAASYQSPHGLIKSAWSKNNSRFELNVEIPANTTATIFIPAKDINAISESSGKIKGRKQFHFSGYDQGRAMIKTGSGIYKFTVGNRPGSCPGRESSFNF